MNSTATRTDAKIPWQYLQLDFGNYITYVGQNGGDRYSSRCDRAVLKYLSLWRNGLRPDGLKSVFALRPTSEEYAVANFDQGDVNTGWLPTSEEVDWAGFPANR